MIDTKDKVINALLDLNEAGILTRQELTEKLIDFMAPRQRGPTLRINTGDNIEVPLPPPDFMVKTNDDFLS